MPLRRYVKYPRGRPRTTEDLGPLLDTFEQLLKELLAMLFKFDDASVKQTGQ